MEWLLWMAGCFAWGMVFGQWLEHRAWLKTLKESEKELDAFVEEAVAELDDFAQAVLAGESSGEERGLH